MVDTIRIGTYIEDTSSENEESFSWLISNPPRPGHNYERHIMAYMTSTMTQPKTLVLPNAAKAMTQGTGSFPLLDKLNFEYQRKQLFIEDTSGVMEGMAVQLPEERFVAIAESDTMEVTQVVGKDHNAVQPAQMHQTMEKGLSGVLPSHIMPKFTLEEHRSVRGFAKAIYRNSAIRQTITMPTGKKTEIQFQCVWQLQATHAPKVMGQAWDTLCGNNLVFGGDHCFSTRQTASFSIGAYIQFIQEETKNFVKKINRLKQYNATFITDAEAEITIKSTGCITSSMGDKILAQYEREKMERGATKFALLSAMTTYSSHNRDDFRVKNSDNINNEACSLADREAEVIKVLDSKAWGELG